MKFNSPQPSNPDNSEVTGLSPENFEGHFETRFDLLSAYLDGEVTASERQQVQHWLDTDEQFRQLYHQLLRLQQGVSHLPDPSPSVLPPDLSQQIFHHLDRQRHQRHFAIAGGFAILAAIAGLVSPWNLTENSWMPKLAQQFSPPAQITPEPLMLALNRPLVEIPSAAE